MTALSTIASGITFAAACICIVEGAPDIGFTLAAASALQGIGGALA